MKPDSSSNPLPGEGDVIAGRFELLMRAGEGGMGVVFRARDRETDQVVALKLTQTESPEQVKWLEREAFVLSSLSHSAIPFFVDWGRSESGRLYLAMEWVQGEELSTRLSMRVLSIEDIAVIGLQIAEALIEVHESRLVHRDLKPSNILLAGGNVRRLKILDFGIACYADDIDEQLRTGPLGTPFYMAPEQAKGDVHVDMRADLYSLGCILFECLTGKPPFVAASPLAVLAKAIFETPIAPGEMRPGVPAFLDALVLSLLEKDPNHRPPSAFSVAEELQAFIANPQGKSVPRWSSRHTLTRDERRLVSVVLATESSGDAGHSLAHVSMDADRTLDAQPTLARPLKELRQIAAAHGALLEVLRDGSMAAALSGALSPSEGAISAANLALEMHALVPEARVALVTAWEVFKGAVPVGQVIDRAAAVLAQSMKEAPAKCVVVDGMTASLLSERFTLSASGSMLRLEGEKASVSEQRLFMGRVTPCVGRNQELGVLHDAFDACASARMAKAMLMMAGPGFGKSRLRDEFLQDVARAHRDAEIWIARGDPMRQKAAFGLLVQFVVRAASLVVGEPAEATQAKLSMRVSRHVESAKQERVTMFLAELVGAPFSQKSDMQLESARQDSMLMGDQIRRAWLDFLEAECKAHTVLLVLEDLHWGDVPTVDTIDASLRLFSDKALFVLALGRPEVTEEFPAIWQEHKLEKLTLEPLPKEACTELVNEVLGASISEEAKRALIERANGNAFFLEELMRATAEGRGDNVPDTVLGIMAARLVALDPDTRRILRAGSIFGTTFWRGAVLAMVGLDAHTRRIDDFMEMLEKNEWISQRTPAKYLGETEYVFRHALIRDAAYEMLTAEDRQLGHRLAGEWLERSGETDAMTLAEHFDRSGERRRAAYWYGEAGRQALQGNDLKGAIARANKSIEMGAEGELLGQQYLTQAESERWAGNFVDAAKLAQKALELFPKASEAWFEAAREALASMVDPQSQERLFAMADTLKELWNQSDRIGTAQLGASVWAAIQLYASAQHARGEELFIEIEKVGYQFDENVPAKAAILMVKGFREGYVTGDTSACGEYLKDAAERFEQCGDVRSACHMRLNLGHVYSELGLFSETIILMEDQKRGALHLGLKHLEVAAEMHLGKSYMYLGQADQATISLSKAIREHRLQGVPRLEGAALTYLARVYQRSGKVHEAEMIAEKAIASLNDVPTLLPVALSVLSGILLDKGDRIHALEIAARAFEACEHVEEGQGLIRLKYAEALNACNQLDKAKEVIFEAEKQLVKQASLIKKMEWRQVFLENIEENARIFALSKQYRDKEI